MSKTNNELTTRTKMMTLILARDGGLMKTSNATGAKIWVLTEEAQDFVDTHYEQFIQESKEVVA